MNGNINMNYLEAREYLKEAGKTKGMVLGLSSMRKLMEYLGNPQDQVRFIHIAGTNGKGSTAAYLAQILCCAGYCTGKYTSPAVFDFREQYQINGEWIEEQEAAEFITQIAAAADRMEAEEFGRPTSFEQETAMAFCFFAKQGCEIAVLETGLGGDEDATNIVTTAVCSVLTSISLDHRRILGNTLAEIAGHKAGIIKPGVPAVLHKQSKEVMDVIRMRCEQLGSLCMISDAEQMQIESEDETGMTVSWKDYKGLYTRQRAVWQTENLSLALSVIQVLKETGWKIEEQAVRDGVKQMEWPGRFQVISGEPDLILDGAHNPDGAAALRRCLDHSFSGRNLIFVIGVLADKDYQSVIRILLQKETRVFTVASDSPRALPADVLAEEIRLAVPRAEVSAAASVDEAMRLAKEAAKKDDMIVVCGSLSFMKEIGDGFR